MRKKYLVQNRKTKQIYESFQFPYILVPAILFGKYPKETRLKYIEKFYDLASQHYFSLPTPIMAGLRTNVKQFSSCTIIDCGDSLHSIKATGNAIVDYASQKAGIGLNIGRLRAEGQPVRNGDAITTGVIPFLKKLNADLKCCSQGAVRGASGTANYPGWHLEFERLIELKNNKGTEETRVRTMDYAIGLHGTMYKRLVTGGNITLFSPDEVPDLYDAFYSSDTVHFEALYTKYEQSNKVNKISIPADEYFAKVMNERFETSRIYIFNADNVNSHTPFYEPIVMTNLCVSGDTTITIQRADGSIEDIRIDQLSTFGNEPLKVWSRNNKKGISEFKTIQAFAQTSPKAKVLRLTDTETGKSLVCTPEHQVYTKNRGYVEAKNLLPDDELVIE
jgi:ribonucleoside-diphosphate reductase alpha chain